MFVVHGFQSSQLHITLPQGSVFAACLALAANGAEAVGVDGEAEELLFVLDQRLRQPKVVEIVFSEGVIGGEEAKLQCQVETGRGFAGAGNTNENHVRLIIVAGAGAVVVVQGKMHGIDTDAVGLRIADGVALVDLVAGAHAQFVFQGVQKGAEQIQYQSVAAV